MIRLVDRVQALQHPLVANFIAMVQAHMLDHELDFVSSQKEEKELRSIYDIADLYNKENNNDIEEKVFYHPESNLSIYPSLLSNSLIRFFEHDGVESFLVLPHLKLSLIGTQDNGIVSLRNAQQLFLDIAIDRDYDEAYAVNSESFDKVIQALFWIARYDATIPEFVLIYPEKSSYFISLSKHGSLYFYISKGCGKTVSNKLQEAGLKEWTEQEFERFSDSGAIEGRFTTFEE